MIDLIYFLWIFGMYLLPAWALLRCLFMKEALDQSKAFWSLCILLPWLAIMALRTKLPLEMPPLLHLLAPAGAMAFIIRDFRAAGSGNSSNHKLIRILALVMGAIVLGILILIVAAVIVRAQETPQTDPSEILQIDKARIPKNEHEWNELDRAAKRSPEACYEWLGLYSPAGMSDYVGKSWHDLGVEQPVQECRKAVSLILIIREHQMNSVSLGKLGTLRTGLSRYFWDQSSNDGSPAYGRGG